jgi:hypothetical protein
LLAPSLPLGETQVPLQLLLMTPNQQKSGHEKSGTKSKKENLESVCTQKKNKENEKTLASVCLCRGSAKECPYLLGISS